MSSDRDFTDAQARVKRLAQTPTSEELLTLYALYKQATAGDVSGKRPGLLDLKGRAKYDAWERRRGRPREACAAEYVELVAQLEKKYGAR